MFNDYEDTNSDLSNLCLNMNCDPVTDIIDAYNAHTSISAQYKNYIATLEKRQNKVKEACADPIKKANLKDKSYEWLKMLFEKTGTRPEQDLSRLAIHSTKMYDPEDSFKNGYANREGELFIYTPHGMWYIINNCGEFSDLSLNNVKTPYGGAVGHRLMYDDLIDRLIRIYTEENEYSGKQLF